MTGNDIGFLAASRLVKKSQGLPVRDIFINSSCNLYQLNLYVKAFGASYGFNLNIDEIEFGTLRQSLYQEGNGLTGVYILFPWDFLGCLDWRTGVQTQPVDINSALKEIDDFFNLISNREGGNFFYLEADLPPVCGQSSNVDMLRNYIAFLAGKLNCVILQSDMFCLKTYLSNGCPFPSSSLNEVGKEIASCIFTPANIAKKVIVTDLDFTFWNGILGEDGPGGIKFSPDGMGYIHFIYQTFLRRLKDSGILLCISSKNDADLVVEAFDGNEFIVSYEDFVSIRASYEPKSFEIEKISHELNLGLGDFVFIDDNPVEIEEVKKALPEVTCVQFPKETRKFSGFMQKIHKLFQITNVTAEDKNRTLLYKHMKSSNPGLLREETDIDEFLRSLEMEIEFFQRSAANNERAVQLINKTNQFNANGERVSIEQCNQMLEGGARLITAQLRDKNGDHGEIIGVLIDENNKASSFVMSCRVFQRQVEFIFLLTVLNSLETDTLLLDYRETDRNKPFKLFMTKLFGSASSGIYEITSDIILNTMPSVEELFSVTGRSS